MYNLNKTLIKMEIEEYLICRPMKLESCETKEHEERLKDRWVVEDASKRIERAISKLKTKRCGLETLEGKINWEMCEEEHKRIFARAKERELQKPWYKKIFNI